MITTNLESTMAILFQTPGQDTEQTFTSNGIIFSQERIMTSGARGKVATLRLDAENHTVLEPEKFRRALDLLSLQDNAITIVKLTNCTREQLPQSVLNDLEPFRPQYEEQVTEQRQASPSRPRP